jgi:ubiquinone/menaquinone biosynthesis C-methylase UbiE
MNPARPEESFEVHDPAQPPPAAPDLTPSAPLHSAHFDREIDARTDDQLWDEHYQPQSPPRQRRLAALIAAVDGHPGQRILDLGCGPGAVAYWSAAGGAFMVGVDYSHSALTAGTRLAGRHPGNGPRYVRGDASCLPFGAAVFDRAISVDMLDVLPHSLHAAVLAELLRVVRPGGTILVYTPNGYREAIGRFLRPLRRLHGYWRGRAANTHLGMHTPRTFRRLLQALSARGELVHADMNYPWIPRLPLLCRLLSGHMLWRITRHA